jgi:hypothetical protein
MCLGYQLFLRVYGSYFEDFFQARLFQAVRFPVSVNPLNKHVGVCVMLLVQDPGNLESDLQTGSETGYDLLWCVHVMSCASHP